MEAEGRDRPACWFGEDIVCNNSDKETELNGSSVLEWQICDSRFTNLLFGNSISSTCALIFFLASYDAYQILGSGGTHRTLNYDRTLNRFRAQNADFSWFSFDFPGNLSSGASIGRLIIIGRLIGLGVRGHLPDATSYDAKKKNRSSSIPCRIASCWQNNLQEEEM